MTDFKFKNEGTLIVLIPTTDKGATWIKDNLELDTWQNGRQVAIEPRFFANIHEGILNENLTIDEI